LNEASNFQWLEAFFVVLFLLMAPVPIRRADRPEISAFAIPKKGYAPVWFKTNISKMADQ
jgi:hypothetical protein